MSELKKIATGGFNDLQGRLWAIDIYSRHQVGLGTRTLTFDADEPAVVEWDELDLESPIQGSALTLRIISEADREWLPLYTMLDGEVVAEVLLEGELWWRGSLDPESYEEPYEAADGYTVELRFTDFAPLKRARFRPADSASGFFRLGVSLGANLLAVGATRGLDENGLPVNIDISRAHNMGDRQDRLLTGCQRGAFLDEDEDEDTTDYIPAWDALTALLQAANLRMIQRAGSIRLFRLTNISTQTTGSTVEVEWTGDRQTLSMAPVASRVSVRHEGEGEENLLPEFKTGREQDVSGGRESVYMAGELGTVPGFYFRKYLTSTWGASPKWGVLNGPVYTAPFFRIKSALGGVTDASGIMYRSFYDNDIPVEAIESPASENSKIATGYFRTPEVYIHLTETGQLFGDGCNTDYRLRILQEAFFDARYYPFDDENYKDEEKRLKELTTYIDIPCRLRLRADNGETYYWSNQSRIFETESLSNNATRVRDDFTNGKWTKTESIYWIQYRPNEKITNDSTVIEGDWMANRQCAVEYLSKNFEFNAVAKKMPEGDHIPLPPRKGWLSLEICPALYGVKIKGGSRTATAKKIVDLLKWMLFKPAEFSIVDSTHYYAPIESASTEVKVICNNGAEDEVEVTPLLGSAGGFNGCRTVAMDANGDIMQGGGIERDIATDIASQMADRRLVLSGESAVAVDGAITFTERNQPGRVFLMQSERMDLIHGWGDRSIVEFLPVTADGLEIRVNERVVAEADPDRRQGGLSPTVYSIQPTATSVSTVPMGSDGGGLVWRYVPESVGCSVFATSGKDTFRTRDGVLRIRMTDHAGTDTMDEAVETDGGEFRPVAIPRGCASVEFRLMSSSGEDAEQLAIVTIPVAAVYDSSRDRGLWKAGEDYYAGDFNPDYGAFEVSHVWLWGCRWRCMATHMSEDADRPGWGCDKWAPLSGDRTLRIVCSRHAEDIWISMAQTIHVSFRVFAGEEDVTDFADAWSIRRESADDAADAVWDNRHLDFQGSVSLSAEDLGPAPHARFTITATLRDPADGGPPRMSAVSCQLSA